MIRNDQIQAAWIANLQANTTITGYTSDIREDQYQGTEFAYPNVRIRMLPSSPNPAGCAHQSFKVSFQIFSETPSSLQADTIAGIIANELHGTSFSVDSLRFEGLVVAPSGLIPAIRQDARTWRSEVILDGNVQ